MKFKKWNKEIWQSVEKTLAALPKSPKTAPIAAFDADGTLWDADLGEDFFRYQIAEGLLPALPAQPWEHYRRMKETGDPRPAYLWLAQINKGLPLQQVRDWAQAAVNAKSPLPIYEDAQKLIERLQKEGVKVYIVTASVKWAVEPGAALLEIPRDHVLGVTTKIVGGLVTEELGNTIPYREGKLTLLLENTKGQRPFMACGNTLGDLYLLEGAEKLALAVASADPEGELSTAEKGLQKEAQARGWIRHQY
jgi:phosphoserine phosphatase